MNEGNFIEENNLPFSGIPNPSEILNQEFFTLFKTPKKMNEKKKKISELIESLKAHSQYLTMTENNKILSNLYEIINTNLVENNNNFVLSQIQLIKVLGQSLSDETNFKIFYKQALPKLFDKFYLQNQNINENLISLFNDSISTKTIPLNDYYPYIENIYLEENDEYRINVLNFLNEQINFDNSITLNKVPKNIIDILTKLSNDSDTKISDISFKIIETLNNRIEPPISNKDIDIDKELDIDVNKILSPQDSKIIFSTFIREISDAVKKENGLYNSNNSTERNYEINNINNNNNVNNENNYNNNYYYNNRNDINDNKVKDSNINFDQNNNPNINYEEKAYPEMNLAKSSDMIRKKEDSMKNINNNINLISADNGDMLSQFKNMDNYQINDYQDFKDMEQNIPEIYMNKKGENSDKNNYKYEDINHINDYSDNNDNNERNTELLTHKINENIGKEIDSNSPTSMPTSVASSGDIISDNNKCRLNLEETRNISEDKAPNNIIKQEPNNKLKKDKQRVKPKQVIKGRINRTNKKPNILSRVNKKDSKSIDQKDNKNINSKINAEQSKTEVEKTKEENQSPEQNHFKISVKTLPQIKQENKKTNQNINNINNFHVDENPQNDNILNQDNQTNENQNKINDKDSINPNKSINTLKYFSKNIPSQFSYEDNNNIIDDNINTNPGFIPYQKQFPDNQEKIMLDLLEEEPKPEEVKESIKKNLNNDDVKKIKKTKVDPKYELIESLLGDEIVCSLSSNKWEIKKHGYELINEYISDNDLDTENAQTLFNYLKEKLKNFKETNFNINREAMNVFITMTTKRLIPKDLIISLIASYYEKLADVKLKESIIELINSSFVTVEPNLIIKQIISKLNKKNNPKLLMEYSVLFGKTIDNYNINDLPIREIIEYCKLMANNSNPQVRTSATNLLCIIYKYLGNDIKPLIKDIKESTLKLIEAELEKVQVIDNNKNSPNIKKKIEPNINSKDSKENKQKNEIKTKNFELIPPANISKKITSSLIKDISDGKWPAKKEACENIEKILENAYMKILPDGLSDLFNIIKNKLSDGNKNFVKMLISLLSKLIEALKQGFKQWTKQIAINLIPNLADKNQMIRNECQLCFDKWAEFTGLDTLVIHFPQFLKNDNVEIRIEIMKFIKKYNSQFTKNIGENVYKDLIDGLLLCLQDRSNNVRTEAEEIIKLSLSYVSLDNYYKKVSDFKPAIQNDLKQILDKIEEKMNIYNGGIEDEELNNDNNIENKNIDIDNKIDKRKINDNNSNCLEGNSKILNNLNNDVKQEKSSKDDLKEIHNVKNKEKSQNNKAIKNTDYLGDITENKMEENIEGNEEDIIKNNDNENEDIKENNDINGDDNENDNDNDNENENDYNENENDYNENNIDEIDGIEYIKKNSKSPDKYGKKFSKPNSKNINNDKNKDNDINNNANKLNLDLENENNDICKKRYDKSVDKIRGEKPINLSRTAEKKKNKKYEKKIIVDDVRKSINITSFNKNNATGKNNGPLISNSTVLRSNKKNNSLEKRNNKKQLLKKSSGVLVNNYKLPQNKQKRLDLDKKTRFTLETITKDEISRIKEICRGLFIENFYDNIFSDDVKSQTEALKDLKAELDKKENFNNYLDVLDIILKVIGIKIVNSINPALIKILLEFMTLLQIRIFESEKKLNEIELSLLLSILIDKLSINNTNIKENLLLIINQYIELNDPNKAALDILHSALVKNNKIKLDVLDIIYGLCINKKINLSSKGFIRALSKYLDNNINNIKMKCLDIFKEIYKAIGDDLWNIKEIDDQDFLKNNLLNDENGENENRYLDEEEEEKEEKEEKEEEDEDDKEEKEDLKNEDENEEKDEDKEEENEEEKSLEEEEDNMNEIETNEFTDNNNCNKRSNNNENDNKEKGNNLPKKINVGRIKENNNLKNQGKEEGEINNVSKRNDITKNNNNKIRNLKNNNNNNDIYSNISLPAKKIINSNIHNNHNNLKNSNPKGSNSTVNSSNKPKPIFSNKKIIVQQKKKVPGNNSQPKKITIEKKISNRIENKSSNQIIPNKEENKDNNKNKESKNDDGNNKEKDYGIDNNITVLKSNDNENENDNDNDVLKPEGKLSSDKELLEIMYNLLNNDENERLNTIIIIHEILCAKYQENKIILIPNIDNIIRIFIQLTHILFEPENLDNIPLKFAKYLTTILCKLTSNKELIMHLSYKLLYDLCSELLGYLLINDLDKIGDNQEGNIIFKSLNSAMLRVIENCDSTSVILVLLELIKQNQFQEESQSLSNLAIRCLIKTTQNISNIINHIQMEKILLQMHLILVNYEKITPNLETKSQTELMIIRYIKNFIIDMAKFKKEKILEDYSKSVKNHQFKDKYIFNWIKMTLESIGCLTLKRDSYIEPKNDKDFRLPCPTSSLGKNSQILSSSIGMKKINKDNINMKINKSDAKTHTKANLAKKNNLVNNSISSNNKASGQKSNLKPNTGGNSTFPLKQKSIELKRKKK